MAKSALEEKDNGAGVVESRAGKGFLIRCEGDEGSGGEPEAGLCWALLCLCKEQRSIHCGWTPVERDGCQR